MQIHIIGERGSKCSDPHYFSKWRLKAKEIVRVATFASSLPNESNLHGASDQTSKREQLKIPWQYAGYGGPQHRVYQPPPLPLGAARRGEGEEKPGAPPKPSPRSPCAAHATSGKRPRPPTNATDSRSKEESSQRKTGSQGLSNTPHAPRSVLELLPGGVGGSSSSLLLPSTHQLHQKHNQENIMEAKDSTTEGE
ncbi:hypothetical protein GBAR_LOCUS21025 [Geodia barretti]|uniref:Uncharacterized protein n=1 Tax=Geodia barretti TaxID=519541 RepID=A0AA35SY32_GEOBA|nr:hypothetical protein GBAR_LOCUS21025 [Geodia barretti]